MGSAEDADRTGMPPRINAKRKRRQQVDALLRDLLRINLLTERWLDELHTTQEATPQRKTAPSAPADPPPSAHNLRLERAVAYIDGERVKLTPALAALVGILASDEGQSADEFVNFKSFDLVAERLGDRLGRSLRRQNVPQLLYRLRRTKGLDARLIETSKEKGVRLRLKRYPANTISQ